MTKTVILRFWVSSGNFLNFGKKIFAWCWKLHFTSPEDFSEESKTSIRTIKPLFSDLEPETFKIWRTFSRWSVKNAIYACYGTFRWKTQNSSKIFQFRHIFAFYVTRGKRTSIDKYFSTIFEQKTFQIFGETIFGRAVKHAIPVTGNVFTREGIFWENHLFVYLISDFERSFFGFCQF